MHTYQYSIDINENLTYIASFKVRYFYQICDSKQTYNPEWRCLDLKCESLSYRKQVKSINLFKRDIQHYEGKYVLDACDIFITPLTVQR